MTSVTAWESASTMWQELFAVEDWGRPNYRNKTGSLDLPRRNVMYR